MFEIKCDKCKAELKKPGALVFSPPRNKGSKTVIKRHICFDCWFYLENYIIGTKSQE